jgi:hypothetical protein
LIKPNIFAIAASTRAPFDNLLWEKNPLGEDDGVKWPFCGFEFLSRTLPWNPGKRTNQGLSYRIRWLAAEYSSEELCFDQNQ